MFDSFSCKAPGMALHTVIADEDFTKGAELFMNVDKQDDYNKGRL